MSSAAEWDWGPESEHTQPDNNSKDTNREERSQRDRVQRKIRTTPSRGQRRRDSWRRGEGNPNARQAAFEQRFPEYGYGGTIQQIRDREFKRLRGAVYLDHAGAALHSEVQLQHVHTLLNSVLFANPHSHSPASQRAEQAAECAKDLILSMLNTTAQYHTVIWTANATAGLKLVGECFPWSQDSELCYLLDNHTSVLGMRQYALQAGGSFSVVDPGLRKCGGGNKDGPEDAGSIAAVEPQPSDATDAPGADVDKDGKAADNKQLAWSLFAYPAESNFSGVRYPLEWVPLVQQGKLFRWNKRCRWKVLLDCAKHCSTATVDLSRVSADFVSLSLYKLFGYPTGVGCLVVRKPAGDLLSRPYFGGGTVAGAAATESFFKARSSVSERLEAGSQSFLAFAALPAGFQRLRALGGQQRISAHVHSLRVHLVERMLALRHLPPANSAVCEVYGHGPSASATEQGPTVAFNLRRPDGEYVGYAEVSKLAAAENIQLRTGCFCNVGACQLYLSLTPDRVRANMEAGHSCGDDLDLIDGQPTGAVRVSLGWMSTYRDCETFVRFLQKYFVGAEARLADLHMDIHADTSLTDSLYDYDYSRDDSSDLSHHEQPLDHNAGHDKHQGQGDDNNAQVQPHPSPGDDKHSNGLLDKQHSSQDRHADNTNHGGDVDASPLDGDADGGHDGTPQPGPDSLRAVHNPKKVHEVANGAQLNLTATQKGGHDIPHDVVKGEDRDVPSAGGHDIPHNEVQGEDGPSVDDRNSLHRAESVPESPFLSALFVYPIKSCAGIQVTEWPIGPRGLWLDREWSVVSPRGVVLTQKVVPLLATLTPRIDLEAGILFIDAVGHPPLAVPLPSGREGVSEARARAAKVRRESENSDNDGESEPKRGVFLQRLTSMPGISGISGMAATAATGISGISGAATGMISSGITGIFYRGETPPVDERGETLPVDEGGGEEMQVLGGQSSQFCVRKMNVCGAKAEGLVYGTHAANWLQRVLGRACSLALHCDTCQPDTKVSAPSLPRARASPTSSEVASSISEVVGTLKAAHGREAVEKKEDGDASRSRGQVGFANEDQFLLVNQASVSVLRSRATQGTSVLPASPPPIQTPASPTSASTHSPTTSVIPANTIPPTVPNIQTSLTTQDLATPSATDEREEEIEGGQSECVKQGQKGGGNGKGAKGKRGRRRSRRAKKKGSAKSVKPVDSPAEPLESSSEVPPDSQRDEANSDSVSMSVSDKNARRISRRERHAAMPAIVELRRFRANLVVSGADAFVEDGWASVRIGQLDLDVSGPCQRCVMVNINQTSGARDSKLFNLLAVTRRKKGKINFGVLLRYAEPSEAVGVLRVGDAVCPAVRMFGR